MDNSMMVALQTQRVLQQRMDATANNLANAATTGFKSDALRFETLVQRPAASQDQPSDVRFVRDAGIVRDMAQGTIAPTGAPFDVAIQGDGFFMVQGPDGPAYTRDGAFTLSADGTLVTKSGRAVLSQGGSTLAFDPQGQPPTIDATGTVRIAGVEAGQIGVTKFTDPNSLQEIGDNLYTAPGQSGQPSDARVVQASLEGSNVRPVVELTNLIQISRAYESAAQMVKNSDDLRKQAVQTLGRAA
jgi:flagellar basal-body rod protein FlgF